MPTLTKYRPVNRQELFNLRHASARNVIERAFGVLKKRFRILLLPLPYSLDIQARIPVALCAIHNFIISHQPDEEALPDDDPDGLPGLQEDTNGADDPEDEDEGDTSLRDRIASAMWDDYVQHTEALAAETDSDRDTDDDSNSDDNM